MSSPKDPPPCEQGSRTIQLPYLNTFETIWEYKKSFLADQIDFFSYIGSTCPICGASDCYREISPYWRYAIELLPEFTKKQIPIARFVCRRRQQTFSLLPIQLIPYFQYTVSAVIGTLLMGFQSWQMGQKGFYGATESVHPDSDITPYLVLCWLAVVVRGLRRGHAALKRFYDLSGVCSIEGTGLWEEVAGYFLAFGWKPEVRWGPLLMTLLRRYSHVTTQFLFGTSSQQRNSIRH